MKIRAAAEFGVLAGAFMVAVPVGVALVVSAAAVDTVLRAVDRCRGTS